MDLEQHSFYQQFATTVTSCQEKHTNLLILSIPGMATSYFIHKFLESKDDKRFQYINQPGVGLVDFNILDLNFDQDPKALDIAVRYFKSASLFQKFALVVNTPAVLQSDSYQKSYLSRHLYDTFIFKVLDLELIKIMSQEMNTTLPFDRYDKVLQLSGGHARLAKCLLTNPEKIVKSPFELLADAEILTTLLPSVKVISESDDEILEQLGVKKNGQFIGELFASYFRDNPVTKKPKIILNKDLSFAENGLVSNQKLLKLEKQILDEMLAGDGLILKEKIADLKWGSGSYDQYSDQAIGKTMQRLNRKLSKHSLEIIPKVGYKLVCLAA